MCMRNINTNVLFFSGGLTPSDSERGTVDMYAVYKEIPSVHAKLIRDGVLGIDSLSFMISINAIEPTSGPHLDEGENPKNTVFFDHKYELCFRLSETTSGKFVDLDTFAFVPQEAQVSLCRKIYSKKFLCQYQNVSVAVPPEGKDLCVLKILIRPADDAQANWVVQSIHPVRLVTENSTL